MTGLISHWLPDTAIGTELGSVGLGLILPAAIFGLSLLTVLISAVRRR